MIKNVRSDYGGDYVESFSELCAQYGIIMRSRHLILLGQIVWQNTKIVH